MDRGRLLVAGASRGVGRLVAVRASGLGRPVRLLARHPEHAGLPDAEAIAGDVLEPGVCAAAVEGCEEVICSLGARYGGGRMIEVGEHLVDGDGVIALVRAAEAAGVRRFVLISSLGVGESWSWLPPPVRWSFERAGARPVLLAKGESEQALRASSLDWTILRPGYLHDGPARMAPVCVEGRAPGVTSRQGTADVAVRALASPAASRRTLTVVDGLVAALALVAVWNPPIRLQVPWRRW